MLKFILKTNKKVANDSPDHLMPHGTKYDNSSNLIFSQKLNLLFSHKGQIALLDLGCSGGGFVKSCLDLGYIAIGLEGSDYSQKERRAEWNTIPDNLFTCDISSPFNLKQVNDNEEKLFDAQFDVVTAWEFIEHIKKEDLPTVCENVKRHLAPNGVWIMSVSPNEEIINGQRLHQTVENKDWWEDFFYKAGFNNNPNIVDYFGDDWVRGPFQSAPGSFHFVLTRCQDLAPSKPKLSQNNLNGDILYKAGVDFFDQGIKSGDILKICYGLFCLIRMSDNTTGIESCLQLATEIYTDYQESFSPNAEKSISRLLSFLLSSKSNFVTSNLLSKTPTAHVGHPPSSVEKQAPIILIDGVFFQLYKTGIARVWKSLLEQWANTEFTNHILVLDRADTAPKINGIRYRTIPPYDYNNTEADRHILQQICDEEGAKLFISSYYTTPIDTPSVFMGYDMIPEVLGSDLNQPMWREKHRGIHHASAFIAISENTAKDIHQCFPEIPLESITVAHCGVDSLFSPASETDIQNFKYQYGINKPYFLLTGLGGYKNAILFLQALQQLDNKTSFDIVATGAGAYLPAEWRQFTAGCTFHSLQLSDEELRLAYAGAVALIYPSKYEGFGMPVIEAMACGCPVITTPNASLPEVAGEAALYIRDDDVAGMADALCEIQKSTLRQQLIAAGLEQAKKFSWSNMAEIVKETLLKTINPLPELSKINYVIFPDWQTSEATLAEELGTVIQKLTRHLTEQPVTLLINATGVGAEAAELFITDLVLGLTLETNFSFDDRLQIHYLDNLAPRQWQSLFPALLARLQLQTEDTEAITHAQAEDLLRLSLSHPNYLIFPDWQQDPEMIAQELIELFTKLPERTEEDTGTILVNIQGIAVELVTEMMLDIMAYLALEQNFDFSDRWEISLFQDLNLDQWQALSPWLQARLALPHENESIVTQLGNLNVV